MAAGFTPENHLFCRSYVEITDPTSALPYGDADE